MCFSPGQGQVSIAKAQGGPVCLSLGIPSSCPDAHRQLSKPSLNPRAALRERQLIIILKLFFWELFDPYTWFKPGLAYFHRKYIQKMLEPQALEISYSLLLFSKGYYATRTPYLSLLSHSWYVHTFVYIRNKTRIMTTIHKFIYA